mmetsp:Transcript_29164/g.67632  ORF Transcript_29164/g.67632 Transcript_29164/m.67632 type:complete len:282 (+) Transcript_29164:845-1690(+)
MACLVMLLECSSHCPPGSTRTPQSPHELIAHSLTSVRAFGPQTKPPPHFSMRQPNMAPRPMSVDATPTLVLPLMVQLVKEGWALVLMTIPTPLLSTIMSRSKDPPPPSLHSTAAPELPEISFSDREGLEPLSRTMTPASWFPVMVHPAKTGTPPRSTSRPHPVSLSRSLQRRNCVSADVSTVAFAVTLLKTSTRSNCPWPRLNAEIPTRQWWMSQSWTIGLPASPVAIPASALFRMSQSLMVQVALSLTKTPASSPSRTRQLRSLSDVPFPCTATPAMRLQ